VYNENIPKNLKLPSSTQLMKSTIIALITALVLLVIVILPAEYGVDLTGIGRTLGLTQMGDIKQQLATEATQDLRESVSSQLIQKEVELPETVTADFASETIVSETRTVQLQPGEASELKLAMNKGAIVTYRWSVDSGHVNYDTHGDNASTNYFGYGKGKATTEDEGELEAAFEGKHGWFWRNRSDKTVIVTLIVSGDYSSIHKVL
jgi:hypothetical protein